ncbi:MAG: class B sortase [Lachnospiraceae bacterium]|nr:class B sortase [Lachnospiraceae bacterium]
MADTNVTGSGKKVIVEAAKKQTLSQVKRTPVSGNRQIPRQTAGNVRPGNVTARNAAAARPRTAIKNMAPDTDEVSQTEETETVKNIKKEKSRAEKLRRLVSIISGVVCVLIIGYFTWYCLKAHNASVQAESLSGLKKEEKETTLYKKPTVNLDLLTEAPDILEEYTTLYAKNKSLAGWIKIEGTAIDYPVMQTRNNDYYLNHDYDQKEDKNGSIFIDCDCSLWPRSQNLLIYGHNMKSGKMFGTLSNYKDQGYFEKHPQISFDTIYEKGTYQVMYVFSETIHEATEVTFKYYQFIDANSEAEYDSNMQAMAEMSLYDTGVTSHYGDELITLSTCDYEPGAERFAVVAKRIR